MEPAMSVSSFPIKIALHLRAPDSELTLCGLHAREVVMGSYYESLDEDGKGCTRKIGGFLGPLEQQCQRCLELRKPIFGNPLNSPA